MSKKNKFKKPSAAEPKSQRVPAPSRNEKSPRKASAFDLWLKPHHVFTILAFIFGSLFIVYTPPFQVPDEIAHFDRAFKLSEFSTLQKIEDNKSGDYVPSNIDSTLWLFRYLSWKPDQKVEKQQILNAFKIPLDQKKRKFVNIDAGPYFYFSYIPQFPAIYIGKLLNLNVLTILYLGRFLGLIFYILCVRYAIKTIPVAKLLLTVVALMPMCLAQAGSSNADCVLFSLSFLAVALLLKIALARGKLVINRDSIILLLILLIIGVLKIVYLPIAILIFLIPRINFRNKLNYWATGISVVALSAAFAVLWFLLNPLASGPAVPEANTSGKISALMNNPFLSLKILSQTLSVSFESYYKTLIGVLGYLDTVLKEGVYTTFAFLIIFVTLFEAANFRISLIQRSLLFIISAVVFTGVILSLYMINHRDNGFVVTGVQGRYFIPILFPFLLTFAGLLPVRIDFSKYKIARIVVYLVLTGALISTQLTLAERYFG